MFERPYKVRIYHEGENTPFVEFVVVGSSVRVENHTLIVDGTRIQFKETEYITFESYVNS